MPEGRLMWLFEKEIKFYSGSNGQTSKLSADDPSEHGLFIFHPDCCARLDGSRQTVTLHAASPDNKLFLSLPDDLNSKGTVGSGACHSCASYSGFGDTVSNVQHQDKLQSCGIALKHDDLSHLKGKPAADIINSLQIRGRLFSACRGKELVIGISNFIIRIGFGLEAHCFWMPTAMYQAIVQEPPQNRGVLSKAYGIPDHYYDGPTGSRGLVSIQAAYMRPDWTLVFVDHNVMITFHVLRLSRECNAHDLKPGSMLWPAIWSKTHGPVFSQEPSHALQAMETWKAKIDEKTDDTPIFLAIKNNQLVFNGYGAQETCDMLVSAAIHPCMPAYLICRSAHLFGILLQAVIQYDGSRHESVDSKLSPKGRLPYISSKRPFRMNEDGHRRFLALVKCYRRKHVAVHQQELTTFHSKGLLNPDATIQDDGVAIVLSGSSPFALGHRPSDTPAAVRAGQNRMRLANYQLKIPAARTSNKTVNVYTPFIARTPEHWWSIRGWTQVASDVREDYNLTTLGPYSFHVFVASAWTAKHVSKVPQGRRPKLVAGRSHRKRPLAEDISKKDGSIRKRQKLEVKLATEEDIGLDIGRVLRSSRYRGKENIKPT